MPHKSFYGKQVGSVLIQVGTKGVAEGMASKPVRPSQPVLVGMDMPGKKKVSMGRSSPRCFGKRNPIGLPHSNQYRVRRSRAALERMA